jgi:glutathione S-transferase
VLVHGELEIFDSTQIFEYLEDLQPTPPLWPRTPQARARARLLEHKSDEVYFPHVIKLFGLQHDLQGEAAQAALAATAAYYEEMDKLLAKGDWLAGDFSYADIAFFMASIFGERHNAMISRATPRLFAWRERMLQRASVRSVAGAMGRWLAAAGRPVPAFLQGL